MSLALDKDLQLSPALLRLPEKLSLELQVLPLKELALQRMVLERALRLSDTDSRVRKRAKKTSMVQQHPTLRMSKLPTIGAPRRATGLTPTVTDTTTPVTPPGTAAGPSLHSRSKSFGASSMHSAAPVAPTGTANFTIVSASGYPPSSNVMVYVKQLGPKPKTIHKTDHIKSPSGTVNFIEKKESFKCACSADTQFQIQVKAHNTFGSDEDLGEGLFFVDESGTGQEKKVKAGSGDITIKSNFVLLEQNGTTDSPKSSAGGGFRRSLLSKKENRENGRSSRDIAPTPS